VDRLKELKAYYRYEKGDKPVSKKFQLVYNIVVPLIFSAIFGSILFFILLIILETVLFFLPPEYPLIITIILISLIPILLIKNAFFGDSWKNSILVKTKANVPFGTIGGYAFRFRKDSAIEATFNQESLVCKVCSKKFEAEMGTEEYDFEICGETEDCKNKLWKL
tara:strand:+ start:240 stop:734 length:495 start_codon:yes stop_codon:yes gene_type:complete